MEYTSEQIYSELERGIINLDLKPGQVLGENELSERFGTSRTPIRTVLNRLSERGLVEVTPYKSTRVTLLDLDEIEQMIYMRVAVETSVVRDFMDIMTPIILEKIRYIIRQQKVLVDGEVDHAQFYLLDGQLHEIWFSETKKLRLWDMIQQAEVHYTRFRMLDIVRAKIYPQIISEHEELFRCIERGDKKGAGAVISRHLYGSLTRLSAQIQSEFSEYFKV